MQNSVEEAKRALREQVRVALQRIPAAQRVAASAQARALLKAQGHWKTAQSILFFAPLPAELDVWALLTEALAAGKRVALPRFMAATQRYEAAEVLIPQRTWSWGISAFASPAANAPGFLQTGWT